jgi:glyoxylase-like metal-dependent hydrolase (beta-lactamase superfamily II)
MHLIFEQIRLEGSDRNFGYLLGDREAGVACIVDPAYTPQALVQRAADQKLKIDYIINTHGHHDHINGNAEAVKLTQAQVAAHPDCPVMPDLRLEDSQELAIGELRLKFIYTPGHCADHIVIYEQTCRILITGDLLYVGKVGGTENNIDARIEFNSLQRVLQEIPDAATVWPGHDLGVRPSSTIAMERNSNPFLRCATLAEFIHLKNDWPVYKKQHGLK